MLWAGVAELADAADLKSAGEILVGSSPSPGTTDSSILTISTLKLNRMPSYARLVRQPNDFLAITECLIHYRVKTISSNKKNNLKKGLSARRYCKETP